MSGPFEWLGRSHELVFGGDYQKEISTTSLAGSPTPLRSISTTGSQNPWLNLDWSNLDLTTVAANDRYNVYQRGPFATTRLELADDWN